MQTDYKSESRLQSFIDNPQKALWSLALPIMFGMGIHTLYNIVDMIFIGQLGGDAITGVALNMPLFFLMLGLTMGLGTGVTATIARFIGENNKKNADNTASTSMFKTAQEVLKSNDALQTVKRMIDQRRQTSPSRTPGFDELEPNYVPMITNLQSTKLNIKI